MPFTPVVFVDYHPIDAIPFEFTKCISYPDAHTFLNAIYATTLPGFERIFTDKDDRAEILESGPLLEIVKEIIAKECIEPEAHDTADKTRIRPLIDRCSISIKVGNRISARRLTHANTVSALKYAITNSCINKIRIIIGIHALHFCPGLNYLNWGDDICDTNTGFPAAAPGTGAAPAPAPAPTTAIDVASAIAGAITTAITAASPPPAPRAPGTGHMASKGARLLFNPASLPPDVRTRYNSKIKRELMVASVIHTPFATADAFDGLRYWLDKDLDKVILADGTCFFYTQVDEKLVLKSPVICKKDNHSSLRRWYETFGETMRGHGVFILPFWLFRKNHGGEWGFTIGDTNNDDVPSNLRLSCLHSSSLIYQVLSQDNMFPAGSRLHNLVAQCYGDGYKALKAIIFKSHPAYAEQPSTLITTYPKQRELSLLEYFMNFIDYLQLRAIISNFARDLDDEDELDVFINNMKHGEYINQVTHDERRVRANRIKYQGSQLLETLERHLMATDSPARRETITGSRTPSPRTPSSSESNSRYTTPQTTPRRVTRPPRIPGIRVNQVGTGKSPGSNVSSGLSGGNTDPNAHIDYNAFQVDGDAEAFSNYDETYAELVNMDIPDDEHVSENLELYDVYRRAINLVKSNNNVAYEPRCIVCNGQHRFENCDTLNNAEFLRQHYIRFCQTIRRDAANLRNNVEGNRTQDAGIQYLDVSEYDNQVEDTDDEDDAQHFQNGRY